MAAFLFWPASVHAVVVGCCIAAIPHRMNESFGWHFGFAVGASARTVESNSQDWAMRSIAVSKDVEWSSFMLWLQPGEACRYSLCGAMPHLRHGFLSGKEGRTH